MLVPDLFFAARIAEVARATGVPLDSLADGGADVLARLRHEPPGLVILDLAAPAALPLARAIRGEPVLAGVRLVGFYPHVDVATRAAAQAAGVDDVLPKSAFTRRLAELLAGV